MMSEAKCVELARLLHSRLLAQLQPRHQGRVILAGAGAFLLSPALPHALRLEERLGGALSEAACAFAVAVLAEGA
jgi:hypothetical protein